MQNRVSISQLRKTIVGLLPNGHTTIGRVSRALGISKRTLQRRLHDTGVTYRQLLDESREQAACRLLRDPSLRIQDIASELGFSDASSFSRSFHRWTGIEPREHRRRYSRGKLSEKE